MAIITTRTAVADNGLMVVTFDYDDVALVIQAVHVVNNSARDWNVRATATATGQSYLLAVPAGTSKDQAIPASGPTRLGISIRSNGRLDGVEWEIF